MMIGRFQSHVYLSDIFLILIFPFKVHVITITKLLLIKINVLQSIYKNRYLKTTSTVLWFFLKQLKIPMSPL